MNPDHSRMAWRTGLATLVAAVLAWSPCAGATPSFDGVWQLIGYTTELRTVDGAEPPLTAEAATLYHGRRAAFRRGDRSFDLTMKACASPGTPRLMLLPTPFEIIDRPQQITFLFDWNHMFRIVAVGTPISVVGYATAVGTSTASRDNDRLVIHSDTFTTNTLLDATGLPHSARLNVRETYSLSSDGKQLRLRLRIEDDKTYTQPWESEVSFRRLSGYRIKEDICLDRVARGLSAIAEPK
jgi:hypothetical protein